MSLCYTLLVLYGTIWYYLPVFSDL